MSRYSGQIVNTPGFIQASIKGNSGFGRVRLNCGFVSNAPRAATIPKFQPVPKSTSKLQPNRQGL
jgi:hypothetical protein